MTNPQSDLFMKELSKLIESEQSKKRKTPAWQKWAKFATVIFAAVAIPVITTAATWVFFYTAAQLGWLPELTILQAAGLALPLLVLPGAFVPNLSVNIRKKS